MQAVRRLGSLATAVLTRTPNLLTLTSKTTTPILSATNFPKFSTLSLNPISKIGQSTTSSSLLPSSFGFPRRDNNVTTSKLLIPTTPIIVSPPTRTLVQYSYLNGKRKTVKSVVFRFYRLQWGIWIRPRAGKFNHMWRKTTAMRKRSRTHVFCNATRSMMLDKMVTKFWRDKKFYVDDPYEHYHKRESFWITSKQQKNPQW